MSRLEERIYSALAADAAVSALAGTRVYPVILPQGATFPAVTFSAVGGNPNNTLEGQSNLLNTRVQFDSWGQSPATVKSLADAVEAAIAGASGFTALPMPQIDGFDSEPELFRVIQDFSVFWHKE